MNLLLLVSAIAVCLMVVEKLWPAAVLPKVRGWWARVIFVNLIQFAMVLLAGWFWDRWFQRWSIFHLSDAVGDVAAGPIAYLVSCMVYYWWHRTRHESKLFWRLCHQLHHSPRRIELVTSFYKHPVEIFLNSLLSSAIVYGLLGCSPYAAGIYTLLTAVAEFFYHLNVRTPHWVGWYFQRPESHRVHHQYRQHTMNYADLPWIDWLFGTLKNPDARVPRCGFNPRREDRFAEMLVLRDVHETKPIHGRLPTCLGCRKRWACQAAREPAAATPEII
jgi:sterol desaturase/sphingolipid hydroxylase (fatty acid hydroxylase superfamily)